MPKLLGIRSLAADTPYERCGALEREFDPRVRVERGSIRPALGDTSQPFDLGAPGVVREIKRALVALARADADPLRNPNDPVLETRWRDVAEELSGDPRKGPLGHSVADAWTGATADEFVAAIGRYRGLASGLSGPFFQLGGSEFGTYGIVGGPQPTAHGLEIIAGAVQERLGGFPQIQTYMAWRDGSFAPPSVASAPAANTPVLPTPAHGPAWSEDGYTVAFPGGDPQLIAAVKNFDEELVDCWASLAQAQTEAERYEILQQCILPLRSERHLATLKLNVDAPEPPCPAGQEYRADLARCVPSTTLAPPTLQDCVDAYMELEGRSPAAALAICRGEDPPPENGPTAAGINKALMAVVVGGALGGALWYFTKGN